MEARKDEDRGAGDVETLYGRTCFTPNITAKIPAMKAGSERAAINAPLQGTAADILKIAMARLPKALNDNKLTAKMRLQAHDELIFEVPNWEVDGTSEVVRGVMEAAHRLNGVEVDVPLTAEAGSGQSWAKAH